MRGGTGVWEMSLSNTESSLWFGKVPKGSSGVPCLVDPGFVLSMASRCWVQMFWKVMQASRPYMAKNLFVLHLKAVGWLKFKILSLTVAGFCANDLSLP